MMTVVEFLLARIAEDEATARDSATVLLIADTAHISRLIKAAGGHEVEEERTLRHFDQWKPKRVLAECAAKRGIVTIHASMPATGPDLVSGRSFPFGCPLCHFDDNIQFGYGPCETVLTLARVWSDHPDFDPAWAES